MAKKANYGYKTPIRRTVLNDSGNSVGGDLTGGECVIDYTQSLQFSTNHTLTYSSSPFAVGKKVFNDRYIYAVGIIFSSLTPVDLTITINGANKSSKQTKTVSGGEGFIKFGVEYDFTSSIEHPTLIELTFTSTADTEVIIARFEHGLVYHERFDSEDLKEHYYNSKRAITIPEQFYLSEAKQVKGADQHSSPILLKSCNRCQRFLPINFFNERQQISFSNHCVSTAPCKHSTFAIYKLTNGSYVQESVAKKFGTTNSVIKSYYGHQLECKACKKFFVNAALNPLRNSTQHREDSLRRRAFEILIGDLLNKSWIYHEYRISNKKEFDESVWERFGKKCFKCSVIIPSPRKMDLDHTMPLSMLYPLDKTATCLCPKCNSAKSDIFPVDFYSAEELKTLSGITGLSLNILSSRNSNPVVIKALKNNLDYVLNEFLQQEQYLKVRNGKRVADSILHSLQKAINNSIEPFNIL